MKLIIILTLVCVISALVLGVVYQQTLPLIAAQKEKEINEALKKVVPQADKFNAGEFDNDIYYEAFTDNKKVGYIIKVTGAGYSGPIEMLVGVNEKNVILGVVILNQQETPGLGANCAETKYRENEPWFTRQLRGQNLSSVSESSIETITGATITTEAIISAIKTQTKDFLDKIQQ